MATGTTAAYGIPGGVGYVDPFAATASPNNGSSVPSAQSVSPVDTGAPTKTPSIISSQTGAKIVSQKTAQLNKLSTIPVAGSTPATGALPVDTTTPATATGGSTAAPAADTSQTTIKLINPTTGQEVQFGNPDLNKQNIQSYLNQGYAMSEASGNIPDWLTPTGVKTAAPNDPTTVAQQAVQDASADLKNLSTNLSKFTVSDADLAQQVAGITSLWDAREAAMQNVNNSREASMNTLGIRLGSRYAGGSGGTFGGIVTEEERQGVQRISDLEGQKQAAISAAKQAAATQNWTVYAKQVDLAQKTYDEKVTELKDLQDRTAAQNKLIMDQLQQQKTDYYNQVTKPINDVLGEAAKNGLTDPAAIAAIQNSSTVGEAVAAAGNYLQTGTGNVGDYLFVKRNALSDGTPPPTYDQWQKAQQNQQLQTKLAEAKATAGINFNYAVALAKIKHEMDNAPAPSYTGDFADTVKLAAASGSTKDERNGISQNLQDFISSGDYDSAYAQITQVVASKLKGQASTNFSEALTSQQTLSDLKDAMTAYVNAGGNTNIFKGKADDIQNKIGTLMTDPQYAALATQLNTAFFNYRKNMTGAAFSPEESAAYATVLPDKSNTLDLNLAKLEGANAYLNSQINSALTSVVGPGGVNIREKAQANTQVLQQQKTDPFGILSTQTAAATNNNPLGI